MKMQHMIFITAFFLFSIGCQNDICTEITKGLDKTPDKTKSEFSKKWVAMETNWPLLSSNAADYMATKEYKAFKEYVLTTDPSVYYLVADKWMEAPLGLYAFLFADIVNTKSSQFGQMMIEKYHEKGVSSFCQEEVNEYMRFMLKLASQEKI